ncbi:unnamed protein product [Eruca vesicaria subsp. sativa]|uniref:Acyl carrier protein n=1 Tax=Eruca vesicaria subsp. sativa TaxID=29727 RepID=A0ABC8KZ02_ERUVS|nr:unnamed protein product [Eruca vesicaria subsp. sativa]
MHCIRSSILQHLRLRVPVRPVFLLERENVYISKMNFTTGHDGGQDQVLSKVIGLVKNEETADFKKDLLLHSLDRVEIVMAIEEEFSVEIPNEKAGNLTCCTDIASFHSL